MQQSLPWLRVPSHRHHLRTTRPPPAHPGGSYLTLRSARNFSMMPCPSELSAGCRLPPWQQRARQVPCHPATAYGPRATGAAVPHGQGDTGSARWGSVSFPSCANPRRWHRCFPRWQRWSSESGSRGRWQPRCGAAWRGGKAGTSLRLPFASPSRGEAKGSAELAASPPPPSNPGAAIRRAKGERGKMGAAGSPPPQHRAVCSGRGRCGGEEGSRAVPALPLPCIRCLRPFPLLLSPNPPRSLPAALPSLPRSHQESNGTPISTNHRCAAQGMGTAWGFDTRGWGLGSPLQPSRRRGEAQPGLPSPPPGHGALKNQCECTRTVMIMH